MMYGECQEQSTLMIDILAITIGQGLHENRFKSRCYGRRFFLILFTITSYLLLTAYASKIRASLIILDVEEPVHNTEV